MQFWVSVESDDIHKLHHPFRYRVVCNLFRTNPIVIDCPFELMYWANSDWAWDKIEGDFLTCYLRVTAGKCNPLSFSRHRNFPISSDSEISSKEKTEKMMMGSETTEHTFGTPQKSPPSLPEDMETLNLSDVYKSAISSPSSSVTITNSSIHSLPPITTSDPHLLISTQPQSSPLRNPKSPNSSPFLDPPSYADVVFSPFHNSNNDNGNSDSVESSSASSSTSTVLGITSYISERPPRSSSIYREISVSDPRKVQDSSNTLVTSTYVTYLISTRTSDTEYKVRRRFRDVVTLSDRLAEAYRGFFIPVRPDKGVVEGQIMQQQDFINQRRLALEKYLRRLSVHPAIEKSRELGIFLQVDGKLQLPMTTDVASRMLDGAVRLPKQLFGEVREGCVAQNEVAQPAKGGRDLLRIFKELKQSMTNDWSGTKPSVIEEDKQFLEMKEKVQDLEQQLSTSSQQVW